MAQPAGGESGGRGGRGRNPPSQPSRGAKDGRLRVHDGGEGKKPAESTPGSFPACAVRGRALPRLYAAFSGQDSRVPRMPRLIPRRAACLQVDSLPRARTPVRAAPCNYACSCRRPPGARRRGPDAPHARAHGRGQAALRGAACGRAGSPTLSRRASAPSCDLPSRSDQSDAPCSRRCKQARRAL